jgi:2-polyprenyl-6-methoxyphenol hydroxylase-like FAD-dependent oxidoreductase
MNIQNSEVDVLVVGAGPTGLTMACELLRRGITCRILDKAAAPGMTSRAVGVQTRTLEVFDRMGIIEEVLARGVAGVCLNIYERDTRLLRMNFRFLASDAIPYPYGVLLPQYVTEELLIALLHREGGEVERLKEVTDLRQEAERVCVTIHNLQDDTSETLQARWLIGCDGAHSRVRKALGLAFEGSTYDEEVLLADVDLDWKRGHDEVYAWMHRDGQFAAMPLPKNHWRLFAAVSPKDGKDASQASLELLQRLMQERTGDRTTTISHPIWMSNFKISRRMVTSYRKGRVFLAGDAAHVHSPFSGQGLNTGVQDAWNLAWKLALVIRGKAADVLLDTYQQERLPIARKVLASTDQRTRIFFARNGALRWLRDRVVIPLLNRRFVQQRLFRAVSELGINYRSSPLTQSYQDARAGRSGRKPWPRQAPRAGDRAPDGRCFRYPELSATSLFAEFRGTRSHLLLFAGRAASGVDANLVQIARRVEERLREEVKTHLIISAWEKPANLDWNGSILLDPEDKLHTRYGAEVASLYLIRPDGYISFRSQPVCEEPLLAYLGTLFLLDVW